MIKMLYDLVTEIQNTRGTTDKKAILSREKGNEEFKKFLKYVLDTDLKYGIQDKKLNKYINTSENVHNFLDIFDCFDYLKEHNSGRDEDVKLVAEYINSQSKIYQDFLIKSITKKLKLGINVKNISKIYKGLFNNFEVMKGVSYYSHADQVEGQEFILAEKKNGIRGSVIKENGSITIKSRQGKVMNGLPRIVSEFELLPDNRVWEGEFVCKNGHLYPHRQCLQKTTEIMNSDSEDKIVDFWLFDEITIEDYYNKQSKLNYFDRRDSSTVSEYNLEHVKWIPKLYRGKDSSQIDKWLEWVKVNKLEGLMYNLNKPYEAKRTTNILKIKPVFTSDLRIIGFKLGKPHGKWENTLGTIVVDYKGYELGIGISKLSTLEERNEIWNNQQKYVGRIVEVEHQQETVNKQGGLSVEYAQFERFRDDKDEVNYAHE